MIGLYDVLLKRKETFKKAGYDADREMEFILNSSGVMSGRLLEAGTGKGHFALALAKKGYSFVTFDISEEEQLFAKCQMEHHGLEKNIEFRVADGENTGFASDSFDVIFSVNVLHHLNSAYKVLDEFLRLLSTGGKIILADFTEEGFDIMDKVHAAEGKTHDRGRVTISEAGKYFLDHDFAVQRDHSRCQSLIVATR